MMWFFAALVVLALGGVALLAAGGGRPMAEVYDDRPDALVPREGPLGPDHLRHVRFSLAFRGYRMSEVDALLDRLAAQLAAGQGSAADSAADPAASPVVGPGAVPTAEPVDDTWTEPPAGDGLHADG